MGGLEEQAKFEAILRKAQFEPFAFVGIGGETRPPEMHTAVAHARYTGTGGMFSDATVKIIPEAWRTETGLAPASEFNATAQLEHPGIVKNWASIQVEHEGQLYTLYPRPCNRKLNSSAIVHFTRDGALEQLLWAAEATQHMHSKKIIHTDLKAENILVEAQPGTLIAKARPALIIDPEGARPEGEPVLLASRTNFPPGLWGKIVPATRAIDLYGLVMGVFDFWAHNSPQPFFHHKEVQPLYELAEQSTGRNADVRELIGTIHKIQGRIARPRRAGVGALLVAATASVIAAAGQITSTVTAARDAKMYEQLYEVEGSSALDRALTGDLSLESQRNLAAALARRQTSLAGKRYISPDTLQTLMAQPGAKPPEVPSFISGNQSSTSIITYEFGNAAIEELAYGARLSPELIPVLEAYVRAQIHWRTPSFTGSDRGLGSNALLAAREHIKDERLRTKLEEIIIENGSHVVKETKRYAAGAVYPFMHSEEELRDRPAKLRSMDARVVLYTLEPTSALLSEKPGYNPAKDEYLETAYDLCKSYVKLIADGRVRRGMMFDKPAPYYDNERSAHVDGPGTGHVAMALYITGSRLLEAGLHVNEAKEFVRTSRELIEPFLHTMPHYNLDRPVPTEPDKKDSYTGALFFDLAKLQRRPVEEYQGLLRSLVLQVPRVEINGNEVKRTNELLGGICYYPTLSHTCPTASPVAYARLLHGLSY